MLMACMTWSELNRALDTSECVCNVASVVHDVKCEVSPLFRHIRLLDHWCSPGDRILLRCRSLSHSNRAIEEFDGIDIAGEFLVAVVLAFGQDTTLARRWKKSGGETSDVPRHPDAHGP